MYFPNSQGTSGFRECKRPMASDIGKYKNPMRK